MAELEISIWKKKKIPLGEKRYILYLLSSPVGTIYIHKIEH